MVSLTITETGISNKPVAVLNLKSTSKDFLIWIERIAVNPNRYSIQINLSCDCDGMVEERYFGGFKDVLNLMEKSAGDINEPVDAGIIGSIFGFLEALCFVKTAEKEINDIQNEGR